jgi:hypothetical protein
LFLNKQSRKNKGKEGYKKAEDHKGGRQKAKMGEIIVGKNYF